jgi:hypothetical protein
MLGPLVDEDDIVPGFCQIRADGRAIRPAAQDRDFLWHLAKASQSEPTASPERIPIEWNVAGILIAHNFRLLTIGR